MTRAHPPQVLSCSVIVIAAAVVACSSDDAEGSGGASSLAGGGGSGAGASSGSGAGGTAPNGDEYGPFAGGAEYYAQWPHGPPSDPSFFPITVWLQSPSSASDFAAIGINTFIGLYEGPTEAMLAELTAAGMPVACDQNAVGLAHVDDPLIVAWTQQDEPDNAQPADGGGYGPCVPPSEVVARYQSLKEGDDTRPVFLNLGQGVANQTYIGWGSECSATHPGDYPEYLAGADIVSFDIYPDNEENPEIAGNLYYVGDGVQHLTDWAQGKKAVWNWIECTGISGPEGKPSPEDVAAEVWMSIVHGSMGIGYFVHQFEPTFNEHALLDDPTMNAAVSAINARLTELAPVLNTPPVINGGSVSSSDPEVPIDMLLKRHDGATYIFAVAMRRTAATGTFSGLTNIPADATADVLGEDRQVPIVGDGFSDDFAPYGVHIYRIE